MQEDRFVGQISFQIVSIIPYKLTDQYLQVNLSQDGISFVLSTEVKSDICLFLSLNDLTEKQFATLNYFLYMLKLDMLDLSPLVVKQFYFHQEHQPQKINQYNCLYTHIDLYCARLGLQFSILNQTLDIFFNKQTEQKELILCLLNNPVIKFSNQNINMIPFRNNDTSYQEYLKTITKIVVMQQNIVQTSTSKTQHHLSFIFAISAYMIVNMQNIKLDTYFQKIEQIYENQITDEDYKLLCQCNNFQLPIHFYNSFIRDNTSPGQLFVIYQPLSDLNDFSDFFSNYC